MVVNCSEVCYRHPWVNDMVTASKTYLFFLDFQARNSDFNKWGVFIHGWRRDLAEYRRTQSLRTIKELRSGRRWTPNLTQNWQNVTKSWIWPRSNSKHYAAFAKLLEAGKCQSCCSDTMGLCGPLECSFTDRLILSLNPSLGHPTMPAPRFFQFVPYQ